MADAIANSVIGLGVDATGVTAGIAQATQAVRGFEQAAGAAGAKAGQGLTEPLRKAGDETFKLTREQERLIQTINNYSTTIGKSRGEVLEFRAAQSGITSQVQAQIAAIKAQEAALKAGGAELNRYGISAKQQAAALRGVPAQVTDIVTSLQGGQAPLTVLLQQGGQLRDMFGGIVPAAKALGSAIVGLVNPYTVAITAVVGLTAAFVKGEAEQASYTKALLLTGNYLGTTTGQLQAYAATISQTIGTQGQAAAALSALAESGKVAQSSLVEVGTAVTAMNRVLGTDIDKAVAEFTKLAEEPTKASAKLNDSMHYLDLATFERIRALEEQGRKEEAAGLAQRTYANAASARLAEVERSAGSLERGWRSLTDAVNKAWNAIAGVGRPTSTSTALQAASQKLAEAQAQAAKGGPYASLYGPQIEKQTQEVAALSRKLIREEEAAFAEGQKARDNSAKIGASDRLKRLSDEIQSNAQKRKSAIDQLNRDFALLNKPTGTKEYDDLVKSINERFKDSKKGGGGKAYQDDAATQYLMRLRETEAALNEQLGQTEKLTASQKELAKFEQQIADIKEKRVLTADQKSLLANQEAIKAQLEKNAAIEDQVKAQQQAAKYAEQEVAFAREMEGISRSIASARANRSDQYERELGGIGQGSRARREIEAQRSIRREYDRYMRDATEKASKIDPKTGFSGLDTKAYKDQVESIKRSLDEELRAQQAQFDKLRAAQADWRNGANEALADYLDDVHNAAGRAAQFMSDALRGGTSSLADAIWDGNWKSFEQLGDRLGKQLLEGILEQQIAGPLAQGLQGLVNDKDSFIGNAFGGLFGTKDTGENWLGALGLGGGGGAGMSGRGSSFVNPLYVKSVDALGLGGGGADAIGGVIGSLGSGGGGASGGSFWDTAANAVLSYYSGGYGGLFGRANGGQVGAGRMYEVTENAPELLTVGNKTMLMMGNQGGNVTPARRGSEGGYTQVNNINVKGNVDARTASQITSELYLQQMGAVRRFK